MRRPTFIAAHILSFGFFCAALSAQQSGAVVGAKPGAAVGQGLAVVRTPAPVPTCGPATTTSQPDSSPLDVPDFAFSRQALICVRRSNGQSETLAANLPWGTLSANRTDVAYWLAEKYELHVFSFQEHSDLVVDAIPGAIMRGMVWSATGRVLSYLPARSQPPGFRVIDLDSQQRKTFPGSFVELIASPDPKYVAAVTSSGVVRVRLSYGKQETIATADFPAQASYSHSGGYLGIAVSSPTAAESAAEVSTAPSSPAAADDDSPDCTGGAFALLIKRANTDHMARLPFPQGFDTVLDFEFSPDDQALAVTFGVVGCDYPGESARIFKVSLPDLAFTPISPADRLSVEPHWSPDSGTIIYTDYTGSDTPLLAFNILSGKTTRLTSPGQFGPDHFLAWR